MSSRTERFNANQAIFWSGCCMCRWAVDKPQYLDVRVRDNGAGTARIDQTLISVFQAGTNILVQRKTTDDLGDAIFRLDPASYDVRAQKAWHIPEDQLINNQQLNARNALIVRFNKQPLFFFLHVDADRNGIVDPQPASAMNTPAPAWQWGENGSGAIILCNNDDDGLPNANSPDNTDNQINANLDATHDMAHIAVHRHGNNNPPVAWTAALSIHSPTGDLNSHNFVRVFNGIASNDAELVGPTAVNAPLANYANNPCTLGVEALRYAGTGFSGLVTIRLTMTCPDPLGGGNLSYYTEANLRVAPWIMPNHLDRPERVYVSNRGNLNQAFRVNLGNEVGNAQDGAGNAPNFTEYADIRTLNALRDPWMQDCMEIGYSNFPGNGNGGTRINAYMKAQRNQGPFDLKHYPMGQLGVDLAHDNPDQPALTVSLSPGGAAFLAASGALQPRLSLANANTIVAAAAAPMRNGTNMTDCVAAAADAAAIVEGAPTVGPGVAAAAGIAAINAAIAAYNAGAANPAAVWAAASAATANVACARAATYAAEAIVGGYLDLGGIGTVAAGQAAANAANASAGGVVPATAGQDASDALDHTEDIHGNWISELVTVAMVAHVVGTCSGIAVADADDVVDDIVEVMYELSYIAVPDNTYNSTGNLEVTPPVRRRAHNNLARKDYRWGRIYYGPGQAPHVFNANVQAFLNSQTVQEPIQINTNWLSVGHVDELMTFVPAPSNNRPWYRQWKLLIASPAEAYRIIGNAPGASVVMNGKSLDFEGAANTVVQTTAGTMMGNANSYIPNPGNPVNPLTWEELRWWNLYPLQRVLTDIENQLRNDIHLENADIIRVPVVFYPEGIIAGGGAPYNAGRGGTQHGVNVLPGTAGGYQVGALTADMVNMLVLNNHLIIPKPFGPENPAGTDLFEAYLDGVLQQANNNITTEYVDDWDTYHRNWGEIHCGTNTLRSPRAADMVNWLGTEKARWWEFPG